MARADREVLARYDQLRDIIAILGIEELSEEERRIAQRARRLQRFLTQPFFTTEQFSDCRASSSRWRKRSRGFKRLLSGELRRSARAGLLHGRHDRRRHRQGADDSPAGRDAASA